jgi:hypothetical protein
MHRQVSFYGRHKVYSFQRSVFSKGGEQRSAQEVGICQKYFCDSNQAGSSPHERGIKFSEDYFSRRDLFFVRSNPKPALDEAFNHIGFTDVYLLAGVSLRSDFSKTS